MKDGLQILRGQKGFSREIAPGSATAWEAWALPLGDALMREANYSAPFPVREETHISTWLIGLPAEDAEGGFGHPPPTPDIDTIGTRGRTKVRPYGVSTAQQ